MADDIAAGAVAPAPAPEVLVINEAPPAPAPAPELPPAAAPVVTAVPAVAEPAATPVPATVAPETPKPSAHTDTETLLGEAGKKPEGTPAPDASAVPDGSVAPTESQIVTYETMKAPEGLTVDEKSFGTYRDLLGKNNIAPAIGQELLNLHGQAMQVTRDNMLADQHRVFGDMRQDWVKQAKADPQIGGAGFETSMNLIGEMRDLFVSAHRPGTDGHAKDVKEFNDFLKITGAGDHPAFLKYVHNVGQAFKRPVTPSIIGGPPKDIGGKPPARRLRDIYNKK